MKRVVRPVQRQPWPLLQSESLRTSIPILERSPAQMQGEVGGCCVLWHCQAQQPHHTRAVSCPLACVRVACVLHCVCRNRAQGLNLQMPSLQQEQGPKADCEAKPEARRPKTRRATPGGTCRADVRIHAEQIMMYRWHICVLLYMLSFMHSCGEITTDAGGVCCDRPPKKLDLQRSLCNCADSPLHLLACMCVPCMFCPVHRACALCIIPVRMRGST